LSKGGGMYIDGFSPVFVNNTITQNYIYGSYTQLGGGVFVDFGTPSGKNNIIWGNLSSVGPNIDGSFALTYSCSEPLPGGTGNLSQNPLFVNPVSDFHLQAGSPCIDTGDPASPLDPDNTRADMGCFYFNQLAPPAALNVVMTPISPPIVIPANGGSFNFNATAQRVQAPQAAFWVWARDRYPDGTYTGNLLGPVNINPPVGVTVTRTRTQVVPAGWPAGMHYYIGYAHSSVAYPATDADSFSWTKLTTADGGPTFWEPENYGQPFPGEEKGNSYQPSAFSLTCSPNPFNPATVIHYELGVASHVSLKVYDVSGRLVATLVDGRQEAGGHEVAFDAVQHAGGIYFARLDTDHATQGLKLLVVK
jgi:hypothetical protein